MTAPAAPARTPVPASIWILLSVVFVNLAGFALILPLLPFFAQSLDAAAWQVTIMFSAYSVGQFFAEPFWGRLSDRIGRKPVLIATTLANVAGYLALVFAPTIWWAVGIRFFTGLGAGNISTIQGYVADVTPPAERAGRMGLLGAAFGMGFVLGPAIGGLLSRDDMGPAGYHPPLYAAAAMAALAGLGVILFVKESRARSAPDAPRQRFLAGLREARDHKVISRVLLVTFVYMAAFAGMESTFGLWAGEEFGWGAREVGLNFAVVGVVAAITQALIVGRLGRRFGEARVVAFGVLLFGASLFLQTVHHQQWLIPVLTGVGVFGQALAMPSISALISRSASPDKQGQMLGLNMAAGSASRMLGPIAAGALYSAFGAEVPFIVGALLVIPAALMAINAGRVFRREQAREAG
ncbi:MAG TPA: MFS transporter [Caulobacteraceae bacterium]|nr:MFS transporter [Caulobacteraceae bacterium]